MDEFLINYIKSGKAWVLVGSGPSTEMGYPDWQSLALKAIKLVEAEKPGVDVQSFTSAMERHDYPEVFEKASSAVDTGRLLQDLDSTLRAMRKGKIYEILARWPIPVYLTTNYDNEIHAHLSAKGESYLPYSNSEDHLALLQPDFNGAIVKLHGDLRSQTGLILTKAQYSAIQSGKDWEYWRTKMTSVFQMIPVIIIGHSLSDPNIQHILAAAKKGAGVVRPICWIAPDTRTAEVRDYLEKYRIRVISYDNRDGTHRNLLRLIETVNDFIPPRVSVTISPQIDNISRREPGETAAATAIYVFNKLSVHRDVESKRVDIVISALQSAAPQLGGSEGFTLQSALEIAGWPKGVPIERSVTEQAIKAAHSQGLVENLGGNKLKLGIKANKIVQVAKQNFDHLKTRFLKSVKWRLDRDFAELTDSESSELAKDIEASLTGYFKAGGLSFATLLFAKKQPDFSVPASIAKYISEASARYPSYLKRQAFCSATLDCFLRPETADREYLGRLSQGFFAFHSFGAFGQVAVERSRHAKNTVWLIDSDCQIPLIAILAPTNRMFSDCFSKLRDSGIKCFTTDALFEETFGHFWFAAKIIEDYGPASPYVFAAASGQTPFGKSNQFLQGFIQWRNIPNPCDWDA